VTVVAIGLGLVLILKWAVGKNHFLRKKRGTVEKKKTVFWKKGGGRSTPRPIKEKGMKGSSACWGEKKKDKTRRNQPGKDWYGPPKRSA